MAGNSNSGRKTKEEELGAYKAKLKQEALEELAKAKVYNHIKMTKSKDRQGIKEIALPVYLKSQREKLDHTSGGKPIPLLGGQTNVSNNNSNSETTETKQED